MNDGNDKHEGAYRLIQSVCDWREENLEVIEDAENNLDYGKVPSYVAYERPADIGTTIIDELCASQGTAVEKLVNYPTTKFERTMRDELFEALAVNETTISLMAKVPSSVFLDAVACISQWHTLGKQARDKLAENSKHDRSLAAVRDAKTAVADKVNEGHQASSVHDNPSH